MQLNVTDAIKTILTKQDKHYANDKITVNRQNIRHPKADYRH